MSDMPERLKMGGGPFEFYSTSNGTEYVRADLVASTEQASRIVAAIQRAARTIAAAQLFDPRWTEGRADAEDYRSRIATAHASASLLWVKAHIDD